MPTVFVAEYKKGRFSSGRAVVQVPSMRTLVSIRKTTVTDTTDTVS